MVFLFCYSLIFNLIHNHTHQDILDSTYIISSIKDVLVSTQTIDCNLQIYDIKVNLH
jgi:hypothetical protein